MTITRDDILAAMLKATEVPADDPGVSVAEYAEAAGLHKSVADHRIRKLVRQGTWIEGWAYRSCTDGKRRRVRVYRPA